MSTTPSTLRQDAFISYKHDSNQLVDEDGKGWVDHFHERLEIQLVELLGRKAEVWRDPRLPKNVALVSYLQDEIKETVALVAILSPGYITSEWCMGELREFCNCAVGNGGLYLNGKSRVFLVVKLPPEQYPSELADRLRYDFYQINRSTKIPEQFGHDLGKNKDQRYWDTLFSLAWDIKNVLIAAGRAALPVPANKNIFVEPPPGPKKTIYLAETTEDLKEQRRQIKEELILNGYSVLPQAQAPPAYSLTSYSQEVMDNLQQSSVSIHLLGQSYGLIPDGAGDRSILRLQLELAENYARQRNAFKRLVWMPENWKASDDKLSNLLQELKLIADPQKGIEFWQTSLEEFKTLMHNRLKVNSNGHVVKKKTTTGRKKVYLICDRRDLLDADPLITYLHDDRGYEVLLPEFEESEADLPLTDLHQKNLLESDGVIVYYGHANSRWVAAKRADLEKHAGLEKTVDSADIRPLRAKAFYVTSPENDLKKVFKTHTGKVITNFAEFDATLLKDFISDLEGEHDSANGGDDNA